ncbi:SH3 domain-containing protein [Gloeothece verrucosa]|uniref:Uncharacterized protein n=1 Tax=Gloeothece verrucosa (strain PCC 7822) TaxID=497965 RepID=E0UHH1_GLOV7|nr:SH3 domain-containing protein [Gloeothece verrucosa]ADN12112.1 hypothetical protein Cyan7822_0060 [Gloeothece verrucosa PCC 7822]
MKFNKNLVKFGITLIPVALSLFTNITKVAAQPSGQAVVFDPPSNVRVTPNGAVLCSVRTVSPINIYGSQNGWYVTDACGEMGYIHSSQIRLQSNNQPQRGPVVCDVINIERGQLALRFSPNGKSRAGLDNGNTVRLLSQQRNWANVRVIQGPNPAVNGLEGWVNSDYLSCHD